MPPCGGGAEAGAGGGPESAKQTGAGGRARRAPPLVGGDGDGRRAHGSRALCARPSALGRARRPAAPHTFDVPQPPLAARDNERRAHGPCAHASGANRRTHYRAARRSWTTLARFAAGASALAGRYAERQQGGRECVRPPRRERESIGGREASADADTPRGKPPPNGRRPPRPGRSFGPQAVTRRSDSRPQALAPGPHPST